MTKIILFYDPLCANAYTHHTIHTSALGGTEATIARIAHALSTDHIIYVAQHGRALHQDECVDKVHYISLASAQTLKPDSVILLRQHQLLDTIGRQYPAARHYFWMHNLPPKKFYASIPILKQHHYEIIAVSHFHQRKIEKRLRGTWYQQLARLQFSSQPIPVHTIYNPIDEYLFPDATTPNPSQLLFTSAPYKGLQQTLDAFIKLKQALPDLTLQITSQPIADYHLPNGAEFIGALSFPLLMQKLRESLCVFYPQTERQETFGLVYAEANAVGTPVLAHDFGAAREILSGTEQLVDANNMKAVIEKITEWRRLRPIVTGKPSFRINYVERQWRDLFNDDKKMGNVVLPVVLFNK